MNRGVFFGWIIVLIICGVVSLDYLEVLILRQNNKTDDIEAELKIDNQSTHVEGEIVGIEYVCRDNVAHKITCEPEKIPGEK